MPSGGRVGLLLRPSSRIGECYTDNFVVASANPLAMQTPAALSSMFAALYVQVSGRAPSCAAAAAGN